MRRCFEGIVQSPFGVLVEWLPSPYYRAIAAHPEYRAIAVSSFDIYYLYFIISNIRR